MDNGSWIRFTCPCGRHVSRPAAGDGDDERRCSRCRDRYAAWLLATHRLTRTPPATSRAGA
jgi:hypothetical protein